MTEYKDPSIKDQSMTGAPTDKMIEFIHELRAKIKTNDIDSIDTWKDKMIIARNMRQGIKRVTDFPYPGAPDIPLPETDKIIRKHKPRFVLSVISGKRFMDIKPLEGMQKIDEATVQSAKKATIAMNWLFRQPKMEWIRKLNLSADRFLEKGFCIFKIIEKYTCRQVSKVIDTNEFDAEQMDAFKKLPKAEQLDFLSQRYGLDKDSETDSKTLNKIIDQVKAGKTEIRFNVEEVTNLPDVICAAPEKVYVPKGTSDIDGAYRITHEYWWTEQKLIELANNNILLKDKVLKIMKDKKQSLSKGDSEIAEKIKDRIEGIDDSETGSEYYRMHEIITWYQAKEGEPLVKWAFLLFADIADTKEALIQFMPYPFEFEGWNYVKHDNETLDDRYRSSRGVPEQIRAIQEFMEKSVNNMLIRDEMNNVPMFTVKRTLGMNADQIRFLPGQKINVNDHDDIRQLNQQISVDVSSQQITSMLKAYAEEYVGISDQLFRNQANQSGGKTLGEVQMGVSESQFAVNLDILCWIESIRKVYEKVFYVMRERLVNPLIINGTSISREDFYFDPDITVNGSLEMADKAMQQQRAQLRLERSRQAVQDGCATLDDLYNAYSDYLEKDGVKEPGDYITSPEEIAKEKITQLNNQIMQLQHILADTQSEIAQGDNTLRQIQTQIIRKGGAEAPAPKQPAAAGASGG